MADGFGQPVQTTVAGCGQSVSLWEKKQSDESEHSQRGGETLQLHASELLGVHTGRAKEDRYHFLARLSPG